MGPNWVLSAPDGPHGGPMNVAIRGYIQNISGSNLIQCRKRQQSAHHNFSKYVKLIQIENISFNSIKKIYDSKQFRSNVTSILVKHCGKYLAYLVCTHIQLLIYSRHIAEGFLLMEYSYVIYYTSSADALSTPHTSFGYPVGACNLCQCPCTPG